MNEDNSRPAGQTGTGAKPGATQSAGRGIDPAQVMFVLALCMVAFVYGVAVMLYKWFPYAVITDARAAVQALRNIEGDDLFAGVEELDAKAPARPVVRTLDPAAGSERLLIIGGPFQFLQRCPKFGTRTNEWR